jgi:hypothetical protein
MPELSKGHVVYRQIAPTEDETLEKLVNWLIDENMTLYHNGHIVGIDETIWRYKEESRGKKRRASKRSPRVR